MFHLLVSRRRLRSLAGRPVIIPGARSRTMRPASVPSLTTDHFGCGRRPRCAVADKHGLSFSADATVAALVRINLPALMAARDELLDRDLIAHEARYTQVLSLPPAGQHRRCEPGGGLMQLGEILSRVAGLSPVNDERSLP